MSLTLGRQGGIAKPLKKRTVGQTNIAHVKGIISLEVPYVNKIVALNQTDLEVLKESLISLKTK
nr:MAG: hypothetical protein [Bacteriophage sp.]